MTGDSPSITRENGIYNLSLRGTPFENGVAHGRSLTEEIRHSILDYRMNVEKTFGSEHTQRIYDWVLEEADFKTSVQDLLPDAWEELRGIADGAGVSVDDVFLLQLFEEVYEAAPIRIGLDLGEVFAGHGCTAFAVDGPQVRLAGQNMDYSGNLHKKQMVARFTAPEGEVISYNFVGCLATLGVNSLGLSVFVTTLPQGPKRESDGLGSTFLIYQLLQQPSVDAAIAELQRLPRFTTLSYTIADFNRSVIVEASPDEIAVREMPASSVLVETNQILDLQGDRRDFTGLYEHGEPVPGMPMLTLERAIVAERKLRAMAQAPMVEGAKAMLTETPNNIWTPAFMTLQSAIAEYRDDTVVFHASAGYDPLRAWNTYAFTN